MIGGWVPLKDIRPRQFHRTVGNLDSLDADIQHRGQEVPILVDAGYEIVDGERRFTVARRRRQDTILCIATGDYSVMVAHMNDTRRLETELGLPSLELPPRAIRETLDLFDRYYPRSSRPPRVVAARHAARMQPALKRDVSGFLGITPEHLRAYRDVYEFEIRADTWAQYRPYGDQIRQLIKDWEERALAGELASPYTVRARLYNLVNSGDPRIAIAKRTKKVKTQSPQPLTTDSPNLARNQTAAINNALPQLHGIITGLVALLPVSGHVPRAELAAWEEQYRQLNTVWFQFARNVRELLRKEPEESTS